MQESWKDSLLLEVLTVLTSSKPRKDYGYTMPNPSCHYPRNSNIHHSRCYRRPENHYHETIPPAVPILLERVPPRKTMISYDIVVSTAPQVAVITRTRRTRAAIEVGVAASQTAILVEISIAAVRVSALYLQQRQRQDRSK
jgi:hypothetical protein